MRSKNNKKRSIKSKTFNNMCLKDKRIIIKENTSKEMRNNPAEIIKKLEKNIEALRIENQSLKASIANYHSSITYSLTNKVEKAFTKLGSKNPKIFKNYAKFIYFLKRTIMQQDFNNGFEDKSKYKNFKIKKNLYFL